MNIMKRNLKISFILGALLVWIMSMPVQASSSDNSLSALNVQNGVVTPDFVYSTWEYQVTVEPGTVELYLDPTLSNANASIVSITGTVLENGEATVLINTMSENGSPMTYTLYVLEDATAAAESESEEITEIATETAEMQTEAQAAAAEVQTEAPSTNALQNQVEKLKSDSDLMIKIVYALIALSVILLFLVINLVLRNRDLKDDLKDAEDQLAYQTNEFARKEKFMVTDNYYAPTQQGEAPQPLNRPEAAAQAVEPKQVQVSAPAPQVEEPAAVKPESATEPEVVSEPEKKDEVVAAEENKDVNVTMVDL